MDNRALKQGRRFQRVPARIAVVLLLFGLSMPMQAADPQVTVAEGTGASTKRPKDNEILAVVSLDIAHTFRVDSINLLIDDSVVSAQSYVDRDIAAFRRGAVLAHFLGNMTVGKHEVTAFFTGIDGQNRVFKRAGSFVVSKGAGPKYVELKISDAQDPDHPAFSIEEW